MRVLLTSATSRSDKDKTGLGLQKTHKLFSMAGTQDLIGYNCLLLVFGPNSQEILPPFPHCTVCSWVGREKGRFRFHYLLYCTQSSHRKLLPSASLSRRNFVAVAAGTECRRAPFSVLRAVLARCQQDAPSVKF